MFMNIPFSTPLIRFSALCLTACCTRDVNCSKAKSLVTVHMDVIMGTNNNQSMGANSAAQNTSTHQSQTNGVTPCTLHIRNASHMSSPEATALSWRWPAGTYLPPKSVPFSLKPVPFPQARYLDKVPCLHRATCEGHWNAIYMTASS